MPVFAVVRFVGRIADGAMRYLSPGGPEGDDGCAGDK